MANMLNIYKFSTNSNLNAAHGCSNFNLNTTYNTHSTHTSNTNAKIVINNFSSLFFLHRFYSTNAIHYIVPIKSYSNADANKADIIQDNKGKSGVYRWVTIAVSDGDGNDYIGSSVDIGKSSYDDDRGDKSNILLQQAFNKAKYI